MSGSRSRYRHGSRGSLLRQAGAYTAITLVGKAIPFLLLPLLSRYLTPAEFGIVAMFLFAVLFVEPFISLALSGSLSVRYFEPTLRIPDYMSTGLLLVLGTAVACEFGILLVREPLAEFTKVPASWLALVVPLVLARAVVAVPFTLLRLKDRPLLYGVAQTTQTVALVSLVLVFVVWLNRTWHGRLEAELITWAAMAIGGLVVLSRAGMLRPVFVRTHARAIARFGIPLIPHTIGAILIFQTDRLLLANIVGIAETGLYVAAYQLAGLVQLAAVSFNLAYAPWLFRQLIGADDRAKKGLVRLTYVHFGAFALLALFAAAVVPAAAVWILDPSFARAGEYVGWLVMGFMFNAMYYMVTNYIFFAQRTSQLGLVTISVAAVHVPLAFILITVQGGVGAAQAMAVSMALLFVLTWLVSNRVYPMPWLGGARPSD